MPPTPAHPDRRSLRALARGGWIPDQHGAWAMALVPPTVGALLGGARPVHLLFVLAWLAAFLLFNAGGLWIRARRRARFLPAVRAWGATSVVLGGALVAANPALVRWTPVFVPLVLVAVEEAWHRRERSLAARISTVVAASLTCAVAADLGPALGDAGGWWPWRDPALVDAPAALTATAPADPGQTWARVWVATALLGAYFLGTVPYVRSLIRARGDRRWAAGSAVWHVVALGGAVLAWSAAEASVAVPWVFALMLARAVVVPLDQARRGPWPPLRIGLTEMAACAVVAVSVVLPPS